MDFKVSFAISDAIYLRDPEGSDVGKRIIKNSIELIYELGFEHFTFKKLAVAIGSTEATIYRYFENKHRLLLYIITYYWFYIDYLIDIKLQHTVTNKQQIIEIIKILTSDLPTGQGLLAYNSIKLTQIVITESSKVYLIKEIDVINSNQVYKPLKDLCAKIANVIGKYNPKYTFAKSLSSTIVETSHDQRFFAEHLPRLTDVTAKNKNNYTTTYLQDMVFRILG